MQNLKISGRFSNFSEKFQGEIQVFPGENMEHYRQNLKISGRNTGLVFPGEIFHYFPAVKAVHKKNLFAVTLPTHF